MFNDNLVSFVPLFRLNEIKSCFSVSANKKKKKTKFFYKNDKDMDQ